VRTALTQLILTDFRSYARSEIALDGRPVFLVGPNGAGKTNLLEAVSLLTPGRGLRNAALAEMGRRAPGAAQAAAPGRCRPLSPMTENRSGWARAWKAPVRAAGP